MDHARLYTLLEEGIESDAPHTLRLVLPYRQNDDEDDACRKASLAPSETESDGDFSCYVEKRVLALVVIIFVFIIGILMAFYYL
jgi:hypothetical protein